MNALDAVVEIFSWLGFGVGLLLLIIAVILWAADGTWLPAEGWVDHDDSGATVRWYDGDGDANSAQLTPSEASAIGGRDRVPLWYRHGWRDRMRLTRRPPGLIPVLWAAGAAVALGVVALVVSWVLIFVR